VDISAVEKAFWWLLIDCRKPISKRRISFCQE
jgi:hypothetical protein